MAASVILDIAIAAIAVLGLVLGYRMGLLKMCLLRFKRLTSCVIAVFLAKPIGYVVADFFLKELLADRILAISGIEEISATSPEMLLDQVPGLLRTIAEWADYDLNALAASAFEAGEGMLRTMIVALSYPIASFIAVILSWIVLFIAFCVAFRLLSAVIEGVFELPALKQINAVCGALVGFAIHLVVIWIICKLAGFVASADFVSSLPFMDGFSMENTYIAKYVYAFHPLAFILSI